MTFLHRRTVLRAAAGGALAGAGAVGCGRSDGDEVRAADPSARAPAPSAPASAPSPAPPRSHAPSPRPSPPAPRFPALVGPVAPGVSALPPLPPLLPAQIEYGPRKGSAVALTFHGQGDPKGVAALLAEVERAGARVTVLAVGSWLDAEPRMARRVLDGGHELGNHTMRHLDICAMGERAATAEIVQCAERLRRLTGGIGRWFRPSRARLATERVVRLARQAGYPHVLSYDVDSLDHTDPGAEVVRRTVLGAVRPGSVVSLHFGHAGTVAALPAILDGLHRRGLRAVTTTELLTR
ncbi:polysaccharide deacetylase [Streptomyces eurocidicus]|uniref:Peptidoglycan/xylan/chitin deacetylase (PgdA/CDA1 family) n=1 Tax=Streptomyces eurocidicus TaxID=66423 RepID=A0A2N8NN69_STREU|nr:polysaccharide deacetylase family protein [Streptomyces eurocidicus]MBB5118130.1 peptidoglycan/xylan/chitin deacetylase (PgdA/CDA1 family) [Streptomyces eurocidicus]MBF6054508.1 polysaccharide deacetylase family protein [Streptomyces eurocidicus]PNE30212.1 polysaccharide deacetylase [Streptomyces eurocidicus]